MYFEAVVASAASVKSLTSHRQVRILCDNRLTITQIRISGLPFDLFYMAKSAKIETVFFIVTEDIVF